MNNKQFAYVGILLLSLFLFLFNPIWLLVGFVCLMVGFTILTLGYFTYAYYRHLGNDPIELIGPEKLMDWYLKGLSQFIEDSDKEE